MLKHGRILRRSFLQPLVRKVPMTIPKPLVHVNHLNRAIKETAQKTTSQIIAERILQESKILLKHNVWSVAEISNALGFTEVTHFNNFFKKHLQISPLKFRNV